MDSSGKGQHPISHIRPHIIACPPGRCSAQVGFMGCSPLRVPVFTHEAPYRDPLNVLGDGAPSGEPSTVLSSGAPYRELLTVLVGFRAPYWEPLTGLSCWANGLSCWATGISVLPGYLFQPWRWEGSLELWGRPGRRSLSCVASALSRSISVAPSRSVSAALSRSAATARPSCSEWLSHLAAATLWIIRTWGSD